MAIIIIQKSLGYKCGSPDIQDIPLIITVHSIQYKRGKKLQPTRPLFPNGICQKVK
jgi:hypothetical protein